MGLGAGCLGFVAAQIFFATFVARQPDTPPPAVRTLLGVLAGAIFACYLLLIGYVNRDAGRRGMNRVLWTVIAIVITHGSVSFSISYCGNHCKPAVRNVMRWSRADSISVPNAIINCILPAHTASIQFWEMMRIVHIVEVRWRRRIFRPQPRQWPHNNRSRKPFRRVPLLVCCLRSAKYGARLCQSSASEGPVNKRIRYAASFS